MSGGVSAEDREKAIDALDPNEIGSCDCGNIPPKGALDSLLALGWRPGGVPARPTREALAEIIADEVWRVHGPESTDRDSADMDGQNIADALLAADHLWAERPDVLRCAACDEAATGAARWSNDERQSSCGAHGEDFHAGIIHATTAPDMEVRAAIFNEGYEAAMSQSLADDPSTADEWLAKHDSETRQAGSHAALEAFELYFCDENENFLLDLSEFGGVSHWAESKRGAIADTMRDHRWAENDETPWDEAVARFFARDVPRSIALQRVIDTRNGGHAEFFQALSALVLQEQARPSAPVVDREALARQMCATYCGPDAWAEGESDSLYDPENWHDHTPHRRDAEALIASGLFVDRASVVAVQREKDAQIVEGSTGHWVTVRRAIAAAIRAGRTAPMGVDT